MKQFLPILFFFLSFYSTLFAQSNGNEWINYDQVYFRVKIAEEGIYRINKDMLQAAGFPISIDPRRIQLYGKEGEIAIHIEGENDGQFDENDFIEFYVKPNDGWLDSLLYAAPEYMLNPHYSLYNDTLCYYLSYSDQNTLTNLRATSVNDQNFDGYISSEFCFVTKKQIYSQKYFVGKKDIASGITEPRYLDGEGYGKEIVSSTENILFDTENRYSSADAPSSLLMSNFSSSNYPSSQSNLGNHHIRVKLDGNTLFDSTFFGYQTFPFSESISTQSLSNSTQISIGTVNDIGISNDRLAIGFTSFTFPHNYNFEGNGEFAFRPKANTNEKLKVEITNLNGSSPIVYSRGNLTYRGKAYVNNDEFRFLIPQNGEDYFDCYIASSENILTPISLEKINESGNFTHFSAWNLSNAFLIISHPDLLTEVQAYANYRNGSFTSRVINVVELYDQYGGGIQKHPLAIKRMINDLIENWEEIPAHLFLIGKSMSPELSRNNDDLFIQNLVPTMGYPPSDNLLTAGLNGTELEPAIPTGRLAAKTGEDVNSYLDKVMAFEQQPPAMWMKNTLHFGGGANTNEQTTFANNLASYENIVSDTSMGSLVYTYLKNTSSPIEIVVNEQITELINGGVSLMTFFGHANGSGFDINIDQPENYENFGKYPLIIASSCYTGNIHLDGISNSEKFVMIPEKGSIAYLATVSSGIAQYLHYFNQKFYTHSFQSHYSASIGENIIRAIQDVPDAVLFPFIKESTVLEMTLHGDPSIVLNAFEKPDFEITEEDVSFFPEVLTADIDSFRVNIVLKNIAKATRQSFDVELIRHFPNNLGDSIYFKSVNALLNYDTLSFTLASYHPFANGINTFDVLIDISAAQVDELDNSSNNVVYAKEYNVQSSQIVPIYPYDHAIIGQQNSTFSAYAGNLSLNPVNYQFQLSTESDFTSILDEGSVSIPDGVVLWNPTTLFSENTVYYWRTASEEDANEGNWRSSSFEFIQDSTGWGQSNADQFSDNQFELLNFDEANNELSFIEGSKQLNCQLYGNLHINPNQVLLDLDIVDYGGCPGGPWIFVMVFDPNTLEAWGNNYGGAHPDHDFGNTVGCRPRVEYFFAFSQNNESQMQSLYNMLNEEIPADHHVLIYSYRGSLFENWNLYAPQLFTLMSDWGSANINVTSPDLPFIFYTQKGQLSTVSEVMASSTSDTLNLIVDLPISGYNGSINILNMGRSSTIRSAQWAFNNSVLNDEFRLSLYQDENPTELFISNQVTFQQSLNLESDENSNIKAKIHFLDSVDYSPVQFENLRLFYTPIGDAAINANLAYTFHSDSIQEGENLELLIGISNPTPYSLDSLLTRVEIINQQHLPVFSNEIRLDSLISYENIIDSISISSLGLSGHNTITYEINPLNAMAIPDQAEQHRFNNKISIPFYVNNDQTQPIVDVTFDGLHIMNGEIISPETQIVVQLKDNSEFLVFSELSDTTNLSLFLQNPNGTFQKVNYSDPKLDFEFGTSDNNQLKVIYSLNAEKDGMYKLLVQAKDKSGNSSGTRDYEIEFEIIHKTTITQVLNYPNPFVDKTHFVFTLTGSSIPDVFTIRIYSANGKLVKEIHKQELGTIRIGNNITDYYWDGTDMYGDRLANGVYFYKVDIQYFNQNLEHRESDVDQYFKMGMGKMYLMR